MDNSGNLNLPNKIANVLDDNKVPLTTSLSPPLFSIASVHRGHNRSSSHPCITNYLNFSTNN